MPQLPTTPSQLINMKVFLVVAFLAAVSAMYQDFPSGSLIVPAGSDITFEDFSPAERELYIKKLLRHNLDAAAYESYIPTYEDRAYFGRINPFARANSAQSLEDADDWDNLSTSDAVRYPSKNFLVPAIRKWAPPAQQVRPLALNKYVLSRRYVSPAEVHPLAYNKYVSPAEVRASTLNKYLSPAYESYFPSEFDFA